MKLIGSFDVNTTLADITGVTAGTGLSGGGTSGAVTLNVDAAQPGITSLGTLTGLIIDGDKSVTPGDGAMLHVDGGSITDNATSASGTASQFNFVHIEGANLLASNASVTTTDAATLRIGRLAASTNQTITNNYSLIAEGGIGCASISNSDNYNQTGGDMTLYHAANDGNPTISLGSSATERLEIKAQYESGAQGLDVVKFTTYTAGGSTNDGRFTFYVDEVGTFQIRDHGINLYAGKSLQMGSTDILTDDGSGTTTLNNIDALDATTEALIQNTGVMEYDFRGYSDGDGTNYEIPVLIHDNQAPFEHNTSTGSDGLTAITVQNQIRIGGRVMTKSCTLTRWRGWATCSGSDDATIGLFKLTPVNNSNSSVSPVLLDAHTFTAGGNAKSFSFSETSFTESAIAAGDILFTGIKTETSGADVYFTSTAEVKF